MSNVVQRLEMIEKRLGLDVSGHCPGTMLNRVMMPESGFGWGLAIGSMMMPKQFFTAKTVDEVLSQAEIWLDNNLGITPLKIASKELI